jgi:hypothetical protein
MRSCRVEARSWVVLWSGWGRGIGKVGGLAAPGTRVVLWAVSGSGRNGDGGIRGGTTGAGVEVGVRGSSSSMTTVVVRDGVDTL